MKSSEKICTEPNEGSCNIMSVASFFIGEWWSNLHMLAGHWVACLFWDLNRLTDEKTDRRMDGRTDEQTDERMNEQTDGPV